MRSFKKSNNKSLSDHMTSDKLSKKSRNVEKLQDKQLKRGRFTKYPQPRKTSKSPHPLSKLFPSVLYCPILPRDMKNKRRSPWLKKKTHGAVKRLIRIRKKGL